jgi:hypothetical protein
LGIATVNAERVLSSVRNFSMRAFVATALQTTPRGLLRVNTTERFARVLDA